MMLMRLGEEDEAKRVLDAAFETDPFNVRVNNTLKVLEVLDGYETLETEHFRIRYDAEKDADHAASYGRLAGRGLSATRQADGLRAARESRCSKCSASARNTDGHGWFSARMVGLPRIHPIGACAGKIVAMQSPTEGEQRFNWARVLKHEFVHVINLQQTDFNIPHWFTEALAVLNEGYPRPQAWNESAGRRASPRTSCSISTRSTSASFARTPATSGRWPIARPSSMPSTCWSGSASDAMAKMLAAYGDNLTTPEALQRAFGVTQADFEQGYRKFVEEDRRPPCRHRDEAARTEPVRTAKGLEREAGRPRACWRNWPTCSLDRRNYPQARRLADAALGHDPKQRLAQYVRARLHLLVGENKEALERLEGAIDREDPQENALGLLAGLKLKAEDYAGGGRAVRTGRQARSGQPQMAQVAGRRVSQVGRR